MIPDKIESTLVEYAKENLSPTEDERDDISKRYEELKEFLEGRTLQNGSYARHTSTTPVNDLDVIYELPPEVLKSIFLAEAKIDTSKLDIKRIIESLAGQLEDLYGSSAKVKPQPHSVGIYFGSETDFSIDVVPAFPTGTGMYWIPEAAHLSVANRRIAYAQGRFAGIPNWIKSHPRGYISQAKAIDDSTDGRFRKAAKAMKKWRWRYKQNGQEFKLKSFHLEMIVTEIFRRNPNVTCFEALEQTTEQIARAIRNPSIPDLADSREMIDQYVEGLTAQERNVILSAQQAARTELAKIRVCATEEETVILLEQFLGIKAKPSTANLSLLPSGVMTDGRRRLILKGIGPSNDRDVGEEFLSDYGIETNLKYRLKLNARVTQDGFRPFKLLGSRFPLCKSKDIEFFVQSHDIPGDFEIKWKVKNTGSEARRSNNLRGQILEGYGRTSRTESTKYLGHHYVECYAIQDGVCVAADHIEVPIGNREEAAD